MPTIIEVLRGKLTIADVLTHNGEKVTDNKILCKVTGEKTPSCTFTQGGEKFYCYSCGGRGDVIDFIAHENQCDINTAIKIGLRIAGLEDTALTPEELGAIEERKAKVAAEKEKAEAFLKKVVAENQISAAKYCAECAENIEQTDYFTKRGITLETQKRFKLGYEPRKKVVTIPYNSKMTYFCTRSTEEKRFWKPLSRLRVLPNGEYDYKNTAWILGDEPIFNGAVLLKPGIVFVCESQIDAISLLQAGMPACAVGGTNCQSKLEKIRDEIKAYILFAFDNDKAGQKHAAELNALYWSNIVKPPAPYKDWNEWLTNNPTEFMNQVGGVAKIFSKKP